MTVGRLDNVSTLLPEFPLFLQFRSAHESSPASSNLRISDLSAHTPRPEKDKIQPSALGANADFVTFCSTPSRTYLLRQPQLLLPTRLRTCLRTGRDR